MKQAYMNPYLAGIGLGVILLLSFLPSQNKFFYYFKKSTSLVNPLPEQSGHGRYSKALLQGALYQRGGRYSKVLRIFPKPAKNAPKIFSACSAQKSFLKSPKSPCFPLFLKLSRRIEKLSTSISNRNIIILNENMFLQ